MILTSPANSINMHATLNENSHNFSNWHSSLLCIGSNCLYAQVSSFAGYKSPAHLLPPCPRTDHASISHYPLAPWEIMTKKNAQSCKKDKSYSTRSLRHDNQPIHHFQMQLKRSLYKPLCVWLTPNCKLLHIASESVSYGPFFRVLSSIGPIRIHICSHSDTPLVLWPTTPPNSLGKLKKITIQIQYCNSSFCSQASATLLWVSCSF